MLTQQQILEARKKLGIPEGGIGSTTPSQTINTKDNISRRRQMAAEYDAKNKKDPNYFQRVAGQYKESAENITSGIQEGAEQMEKGGVVNALRGAKTSALRTVGGVAEATFAPITEAPIVKQGLEKLGEGIAKIPGVDWLVQKSQELEESNPELAKDLKNIVDIAVLGAGSGGVKAVEKGVGNVAKSAELPIKEATSNTLIKTGSGLKSAGKKLYDITVKSEEPVLMAKQAYDAARPSLFERVSGFLTGNKIPKAKSNVKSVITESETAARQGLVGTEWQLGAQAKRAMGKIWDDTINPMLKANKEKFNMKSFIDDLRADITKNTSDITRKKSLLKALDAFADDYKNVSNFTLSKLQKYKQGWAEFLPSKVYKGEEVTAAVGEIRNIAARKARQIIYEKLGPEAKQAYIDYSNLQSIAKAGIKSVDPLRSKSAFKQAWEFLLDTGVTPVTTLAGQVLYKTGEGLEFIGKEGAKKVRDIISTTEAEAKKAIEEAKKKLPTK